MKTNTATVDTRPWRDRLFDIPDEDLRLLVEHGTEAGALCSLAGCGGFGTEHQPRERAVPCQVCRHDTWNSHAIHVWCQDRRAVRTFVAQPRQGSR